MPFGPGRPGIPGRPASPFVPGAPGIPGKPFGPYKMSSICMKWFVIETILLEILLILSYLEIHDHLFHLVDLAPMLILEVLLDLNNKTQCHE
jgi:hypothetical protein